MSEDRRRFGRIHLLPPLPAHVGDARADLVDLAVGGARIISYARFAPGTSVELKFHWEGHEVRAICRVVRCTLAQFAKAPGEKSTYQSGLQTTETIGDSDHVIREMIATHVVRALEEQRANALGLPPLGPLIDISGVGNRFRKCEFVDGKWRRSETPTPDQPMEGFTISAEVPMHYVTVLCETYQAANEEARRLTRTLAQLSVTRGEGVPVRRYIP